METDSIFIQNNATSRIKLWNIQQKTIGHYRSSNQVETISTRCHREVQSLDRSCKFQVFQRAIKTKWMIGKMVPQIIGLQLYTITHTRENKYESRHSLKEGPSKYTRW